MASTVRTIGYEGATLSGFLSALRRARVSLIVDIRAVAVSRRKGFSKNALASALREIGIDYMHLRGLGDPKAGREAARAGRMSEFRAIYANHLRSEAAQAALAEAIQISTRKSICLLCYEAESSGCHRTIVAASIARKTGLVIQHLSPDASSHVGSTFTAAA
ncbi:DUF488 domain-containing protein [Roseococcus sp. SYP-B2431]|uniref:DUF488 domain-containing protein n=1 Tax=Roseococcus sp. SYP-B2431 TaxID=2496640 RepID=UPI00103E0E41|nr:DUF488 domain-containing protein [Roseococcus sp. SYP-B2431]